MGEVLNSDGLWAVFAGVMAAIVGTVLAFLLGRFSSMQTRRQDVELLFVQSQLKDLYGPLYALSSSNHRTYKTFAETHAEITNALDAGETLSSEHAKIWINWTKRVFQPANQRMRNIILEGGHLFREGEMPPVVLEFLAHVDNYEALVETFDEKGLTLKNELVPFPADFPDYVKREYEAVSDRYKSLGTKQLRS